MRKRILDQPIDIINKEEASYRVKASLLHSRQLKIITLNPEMVINASKNIEFQSALNNANLIVPDGTGIVWALKLLSTNNSENLERIPGIELAENILQFANESAKKIAILGGTKEVLENAVVRLREKYKNIEFVKTIDGFKSKEEDKNIAKEIAESSPDIVLVALGTPRQEIWINKYNSLFPKSIMIGIGGSLDVWSGKKPRAPEWVREKHLEWLFRAIIDPQRIPRVLSTLPIFVLLVMCNVIARKLKEPTKQ